MDLVTDFKLLCQELEWRVQGKKSSPYLGVSLWFGDILSEKQCPICLRLHEKAFGNQKISRGRAPRPLHSEIFLLSNCTPPPHQKSWIRPCNVYRPTAKEIRMYVQCTAW